MPCRMLSCLPHVSFMSSIAGELPTCTCWSHDQNTISAHDVDMLGTFGSQRC
jgi:hypothetical protein